MENILVVIKELGELINKYKTDITYKEHEIKYLREKIEKIESKQD